MKHVIDLATVCSTLQETFQQVEGLGGKVEFDVSFFYSMKLELVSIKFEKVTLKIFEIKTMKNQLQLSQSPYGYINIYIYIYIYLNIYI